MIKSTENRNGSPDLPSSPVPGKTIDQAMKEVRPADRISYREIGGILIEAGLVTKEQITKALLHQGADKRKILGDLLIDGGYITEAQFLMALARKFKRDFVDLSKIKPDQKALAAISRELAYELKILPIDDQGDQLTVAASDPVGHALESVLKSRLNRKVKLVVATPKQIAGALEAYYQEGSTEQIAELVDQMSEDDDAHGKEVVEAITESDSRIVTLVNKLLTDAYAKRASDIHFDPGLPGRPFEIRFRVDGVCHLAHAIPEASKRAIISRIKIMSNLDISERRKPQSGKFMLRIQEKKVEFRVEVTPTADDNENVVLRLLNQSKPIPIEQLDLAPYNLSAFLDMITKPQGIVLCVGPTGSGKTTTLHSALGHINKPEITIWTAEDPVEIRQPGLKQVQVNSKIGYTFSEALRSFLRADPDVIMIGEMRDAETAKISLDSSLTGHLVFSTLHTNSAAETIIRIIEMGIPFYNFADAILGIVAQRLVRKLCEKCKTTYHPEREEYDELLNYYGIKWAAEHGLPEFSPDLTLWRRSECDFCNGTGYYGRVALHEIMVATANVKKAIRHNENVEDLKEVALKDGMRTLQMDGVLKILQGITDFGQVKRVCL